jgi:hypothetical protein
MTQGRGEHQSRWCSRLTDEAGGAASLACWYPRPHLLEATVSHHLDSPKLGISSWAELLRLAAERDRA